MQELLKHPDAAEAQEARDNEGKVPLVVAIEKKNKSEYDKLVCKSRCTRWSLLLLLLVLASVVVVDLTRVPSLAGAQQRLLRAAA